VPRRLDHFHFYFAPVETRSVWPFFGGTATSNAVPPGTPKVKMVQLAPPSTSAVLFRRPHGDIAASLPPEPECSAVPVMQPECVRSEQMRDAAIQREIIQAEPQRPVSRRIIDEACAMQALKNRQA
jgi:hypothetical protein